MKKRIDDLGVVFIVIAIVSLLLGLNYLHYLYGEIAVHKEVAAFFDKGKNDPQMKLYNYMLVKSWVIIIGTTGIFGWLGIKRIKKVPSVE